MNKRSLRVTHVHLGIKGGAERFFVNLVGALAEHGVAQQAFLFPNRVWKDQIEDMCEVHEFGFSRSHISRFFINRKIARLNADFGTDVMLSWMPQATRWLPKDPSIFKVARLGDYPEKLDYFANCDHLVCNTPDIARSLEKMGWPPEKLKVISNFTDTTSAVPIDRTSVGTSNDAYVVLGMGRFVKRKGFDSLVRALIHAPPDVMLWLMGDGEEKDALCALVSELGLERRVRFLGWSVDPGPVLASADALSIPSRHEPLGNVVLEAWACGKPVVATASEGPSWLIENDVNGLLVPVDDDVALGAAIGRLKSDVSLSLRLVAGATAKLEKEHSRHAIAQAYFDFFDKARRP